MWNLRLQERDLSSYSLQMWAPTPRPVRGSPSSAPCGHGAGEDPGISRAKAQPELSAGGLEGTPSSAVACSASEHPSSPVQEL